MLIKFIVWLSNKLGFKIVMLNTINKHVNTYGDKDLIKYVDITGYYCELEPLRRGIIKEERKMSDIMKSMPYSHDRIGQTIITNKK